MLKPSKALGHLRNITDYTEPREDLTTLLILLDKYPEMEKALREGNSRGEILDLVGQLVTGDEIQKEGE